MFGTPRVEQAVISLVTWCPDVRPNRTLREADEKKVLRSTNRPRIQNTSKPVIFEGI